MKLTRHCVAVACFALCLAATAATQQVPDSSEHGADRGHGPERPGDEDGRHDFGGHGPGMPGPDMPFEGAHGGMMHHLRRLNLSEAQQDKLFAIQHAVAPERREHARAIRKAHEALRELAHAERFDDARANALSRELGQAVAAEALLQARTAARMLAVLTPEQREQLRPGQREPLRRHRSPGPQLRPEQTPQAPQDQQGRAE